MFVFLDLRHGEVADGVRPNHLGNFTHMRKHAAYTLEILHQRLRASMQEFLTFQQGFAR